MRVGRGKTRRIVVTTALLLSVWPAVAQEEITDVAGWSDAQIEAFLSTATVVKDVEVGSGITNPHRLTLEKDGQRLRAIFKNLDGYTGYVSGESLLVALNQTDRYHYDVAAYRIDRMLGLDMVPPAVLRTVNGQEGVAQLWIENAFDEEKRAAQGMTPPDSATFERQWQMMHAFDILIFNVDRNAGNILYTEDWQLRPIDHTRAFRLHGGRPENLRKVDLMVPPELVTQLESLDDKALKESMKGLLHAMQVKAVLKRRDQLIKYAQKHASK
jgi:hypothetical protein